MLALIEWLDTGAFNLALTASPLVWRQIKTMVSSVRKGAYAVGFRASLFIVMASFSAKKKLRWKGGAELDSGCVLVLPVPLAGNMSTNPKRNMNHKRFGGTDCQYKHGVLGIKMGAAYIGQSLDLLRPPTLLSVSLPPQSPSCLPHLVLIAYTQQCLT